MRAAGRGYNTAQARSRARVVTRPTPIPLSVPCCPKKRSARGGPQSGLNNQPSGPAKSEQRPCACDGRSPRTCRSFPLYRIRGLPRGNDTTRADDDPPVCHVLMAWRSRFPQAEQRQRASGGTGSSLTSRCPLWPHRRHSMKIVAVCLGTRRAYARRPHPHQARSRATVWRSSGADA